MTAANQIILREAGIEDLSILTHWDEQPHVIASDPNDDWEWEVALRYTPKWQEQLIAELEGRPLGFIQIIDPEHEETKYWGEIGTGFRAIDIWIGDVRNLGKGYGTQMMKLAIDRCFASPEVKAILIDPLQSNKRAHRFYERLGFRFVEERFFGEDLCRVYSLVRENWIKNAISK